MARATRDERRSVLRCAEVVVATLSAAGGDLPALLASGGRGAARDSVLRFDAVIIDEAAQAIEPATLIPMHLLDPVKVSSPAMCLSWLRRCYEVGTAQNSGSQSRGFAWGMCELILSCTMSYVTSGVAAAVAIVSM